MSIKELKITQRKNYTSFYILKERFWGKKINNLRSITFCYTLMLIEYLQYLIESKQNCILLKNKNGMKKY